MKDVQMMSVGQVLEALGETDCLEAVAPSWEESMKCLPGGGLPFLDPGQFRESRAWCGFDSGIEPLLEKAAAEIAGDRALLLLAWHCNRTVFEWGNQAQLPKWPRLEKRLGKDLCGMFYLLVALDMAPRIRPIHAGWGIPEGITRDTCRQVSSFCHTHELCHQGRKGVQRGHMGWLRNYVNGDRYFRLGRLEFRPRIHEGDLAVFHRPGTTDTLAFKQYLPYLTKEDLSRTEVGGEKVNPSTAPTLPIPAGQVLYEGYPIAPHGFGLDRKVILSPQEWRPVLTAGDRVLEMHIPSGGGMTPEACRDSFSRADAFFKEYFPSEPAVAFRCYSWIFNTQFEFLLSPEANLVRFMRELYLFPLQSKGTEGLGTIFAQEDFDFKTAPRKTSLQRAVAGFLDKGNEVRHGGMFFLLDDLKHYGTQFYRRTWKPGQWRGVRF